jgi:NADH dehydrogenase/NADH:ubiquinone oxidoreductase subunit G
LVDAIKKLNISVPTLCHNENVKAYGVCRICQVEVVEQSHGREKTRLVPSCVYEVRQDGLRVTTTNDRIYKNRQWLIQFLLARCEDEQVVKDLAAEYDVVLNERLTRKKDDCILCGLCVRACTDVVGVSAIAFEGRGENREVTTPWREENPICIACGTCAYVCPTGCISMEEKDGERIISRWHGEKKMTVRRAKMLSCDKCGNYYLPEALTEVYKKKMDIDPKIFRCPSCR